MNIFPAIDLYDGCAVRLIKGDYNQMQIYSNDPASVAKQFEAAGAEYLHVVDLAGARDGNIPNLDTIRAITENTSLKVEVGGGIRSEEVIRTYLSAGVFRVILGTVAVTDPEFTKEMVSKYGEQIAVGVDIRDGFVAIKGWTEKSDKTAFAFCEEMVALGVKTLICTDISKDGAMKGTNIELYRHLSENYPIDMIASGGVSSLDDVSRLKDMNVYGAILGKALYTGSVDLAQAVRSVKGE